MSDEGIVVQFKAVIDEYLGKLNTAAKGTGDATAQMNAHLETVGKGFEKMMGALGAVTAILAGGKMFKDAIDETVKWTMEVNRLSKVLGTNLQDASAWAVGLHTLGIPAETIQGIVGALTNRIAQGGAAFEKAGIAFKDSEGRLKPMGTLIPEIADKAKTFTDEGEKNAFLATVLGRRWMEFLPILRMTAERMEENRKEMKEFGLEVDENGVAKTREYQESMRKLELVTMSMKNALGKELMPVLQSIGSFLGGEGGKMVEGFGYVLKGVVQAFYFLKAVIETIAIAIGDLFGSLITIFQTLGDVMTQVLQGNYADAVKVAKAGMKDLVAESQAADEGIAKSWADMAKNSAALWKPAAKMAPEEKAPGPKFVPVDKDKKDESFAKWEKELTITKAAFAQTHEMREIDKKDEIKFWMEKAADASAGAEARAKAVLKAQGLIDSEAKKAAAQAKKDALEQRQLDAEESNFKRELARIDLNVQKQVLSEKVAAGRMSKEEELRELIKLRQAEAAIDKAAVLEQLKNDELTLVQRKKLNDQLVLLDKKAGVDVAALDRQIVQTKVAEWKKVGDQMAQGFGTAVRGIIDHTMTLNQALAQMAKQALMTLAQMAIKSITTSGAKGGAAAAASAAEDGPTGWMMAIPVGLSVMAAILGLSSSVASAAGGFDIPSGVNPMTQLHAREMVLPAEHADTIRGLKGGGASAPQIHIHALDAKSFKDALGRNQGGLLDVLKQASRNGRVS